MELKEKLISSFMAFEERIDVHAELHDVRTAIKNFENKGFPTKRRSLEIHLVKYHSKK
jgi:Fe-S cluster assembly protein SufD